MTKRVIIAGGGLAGLSLAYELEKAGVDYLLFEENQALGGLCGSWQDTRGDWHDFGPHIFHGREGFDWFRELVPDHIQGVRNDVVILSDREVTSYPVQCACGDMKADAEVWSNYAEHCFNEYGSEMFWRFFYPYNEKMFGCSISELDRSIAGRAPRVHDRLQPYLYPKSGRFAEIAERLYSKLDPSKVHLGSPVNFVDRSEKFVVSGGRAYGYEKLVWAAPIQTLLRILGRRKEQPDLYIDLLLATVKETPTLEFLAKYSALTADEFYRMSTERVIKQDDSPYVQYEINLRRCIGTWFNRGGTLIIPEAYVVPTTDWMTRRVVIQEDLLEEDILLHGRAGRGVHMNIWPIICASKELLSSLV